MNRPTLMLLAYTAGSEYGSTCSISQNYLMRETGVEIGSKNTNLEANERKPYHGRAADDVEAGDESSQVLGKLVGDEA
jgi:hypothetical protein